MNLENDPYLPDLADDSNDEKFDALICQISEKLDHGTRVKLEDYEQRHPAFAARLRRIWPTLMALADLGHGNHDRTETDSGNSPNAGLLGDFQIIREAGRGGMGVVYEATQVSLGRRVALKVLPFASVMDQRQLQRFKNEAMAAAALDHPNIVKVFATGCERSIHFYAMHFIEGQTLADVIAAIQMDESDEAGPGSSRSATESAINIGCGVEPSQGTRSTITPSAETRKEVQAAISTVASTRHREYYRSVAEIGKQAAHALDYAHGLGIVHRDIKPSNLMLDAMGRCWVTDFGLAMVESSPNLTMTGDVLGTLRYMSPEQAMAKRVVVDHRTDIYSLGATLYELLTLKPVLRGEDRQELLRQLTYDEPLSPRKVVRSIPVELETIILKALAKRATDRYETAAQFANDLDAFLTDRPIAAQRPGPLRRARKWMYRHRMVSSIAVCMMLALVLAAGGAKLKQSRHHRELVSSAKSDLAAAKAAMHARDLRQASVFMHAVDESVRQTQTRDRLLLSQADQIKLELTRRREARERFERFQDSFRRLHALLHSNEDSNVEVALAEYNVLDGEWREHADFEFLSPRQVTQLKQQIVETLFLVGWRTIRNNGQLPARERRKLSRQAIDYWLRIGKIRESPSPALHLWLADAWKELGENDLADAARARHDDRSDRSAFDFYMRGRLLQDQDRFDLAVDHFSEALRRDPGHIWSLQAMGMALLDAGRPMIAEPYYLNLIHRLPDSSVGYFGRGKSLLDQGKYDLAVEDFSRVSELEPKNYWGALWAGKALRKKGDMTSALEKFKLAAKLNPNSPRTRLDLAETYVELNDDQQAKQQFDLAIEQATEMIDYHRGARRILPRAHLERSKLHLRAGQRDKAVSDIDAASRVARNAKDRFALRDVAWFLVAGPDELRDPRRALPLAEASVEQRASYGSRFILAIAQFRVGEYENAVATAGQIVESSGHYSQTKVHFLLAASYWHLNKYDLFRKWYDRGVEDKVVNFREEADRISGLGNGSVVERETP